MFPETFTLLQSEGHLMQHCFKSALGGLKTAPDGQPGPFYAAFFNYAIGLERLLKMLVLLDNWHRERDFPTDKQLRQYGGKSGHNVKMLYDSVLPLFKAYGVHWQNSWDLDDIDEDFLEFLADFANGSRYFNLDMLVGAPRQTANNPIYRWQRLFYSAYERDHSNPEPATSRPDVPEDMMDTSELTCHHIRIVNASRHICCRLVRLLVPLRELLIAMCEHIRNDDFVEEGPDADPSVPQMDEFLEFVTGDKAVILKDEDWP
jgi:hypothetical protein